MHSVSDIAQKRLVVKSEVFCIRVQ